MHSCVCLLYPVASVDNNGLPIAVIDACLIVDKLTAVTR